MFLTAFWRRWLARSCLPPPSSAHHADVLHHGLELPAGHDVELVPVLALHHHLRPALEDGLHEFVDEIEVRVALEPRLTHAKLSWTDIMRGDIIDDEAENDGAAAAGPPPPLPDEVRPWKTPPNTNLAVIPATSSDDAAAEYLMLQAAPP